LAALGGCVAEAGVGYQATVVTPTPVVDGQVTAEPEYEETAYVEPSETVYISPEVQVIADYDYPVFYSDGLYWRYEGDVWYSSSYHDRGWGEYHGSVPEHISHIDRSQNYVHYHGNVSARRGEAGYVEHAPVHPVHSSPPPKYIEHPPAHRGEAVYRQPKGGNVHTAQPSHGNVHTEPSHGNVHTEPSHGNVHGGNEYKKPAPKKDPPKKYEDKKKHH
jgi:hypothetical protein